jgi:hypothetical protein
VIGAALRRALGPLDPRTRAQVDRDIRDEFAFHLAMLERDLGEEGLTGDAARAESERRFGNIAALHRRCLAAAVWEKAMLQKLNLGLLLAIGALLAWAVLVQQRQLASAAEREAALREQTEAATAHLKRASAAVPEATRAALSLASPVAGAQQGFVYFEGNVERPGTYSLSAGVTLRRALAAAGGPLTGFRVVTVVNGDDKGGNAVRFSMTDKEYHENPAGVDIELMANDLVRVE